MIISIKLLVTILITINFSNTYAEYSKEFIEHSSDVLVAALPTAAFAQTFAFNDRKGTVQLLIGVASAQVVTQTLKVLIDKPRPSGEDNKSMPSGHSTTAFQSSSFVHFRYGIKYAIPYYCVASYVVWARIYTENHYLEDTLVGASIGVLTSWIITDKFETTKVNVSSNYGGVNNMGLAFNYKF